MTKRIICLFMIFVLCLSLTACGSDGTNEQIIYPIDEDPRYLDPQIISSDGAKNIIANSFEGLVTLGADGEILPGCAESWTVSKDGLKYTFTLRENCQWYVSSAAGALIGENYKETFDSRVTAEDFAFAFRRALRPETKSPGAKSLYSIKNAVAIHRGTADEGTLGVYVKDDYTLLIYLEWADPDFLYSLLDAACMPCNEEFFEATGGRYGLSTKYLIYNGPFYISNWADDTAITLKRNEKYYAADRVAPSSVYFSINSEQSTRAMKIEDGIYEVAPLTESQASQLQSTGKYTVEAFSSTVLSLIFNCQNEVFTNLNVRRAVVSSFDYEAVYGELGAGTAEGIIPGTMIVSGDGYREKVGTVSPYHSDDPDALFDTGLEELGKQSVDVTVLCLPEHESIIRTLMQTWQAELGVRFNVFVEALEMAELKSRVGSGNYQMAFYPVSYSSITAFNGLLRFTSDNANNICRLSDKTYDATVNLIKTANGKQATVDATLAAEKYLMATCAIIPLYEQNDYYGLANGVSGIIFNTTGETLYFKYALSK